MTRDELKEEYFVWICQLVSDKECFTPLRHKKMLRQLFEIPFIWLLPLDGDRAMDGVNLRYRFGAERSYDDRIIASYLDDVDCSVLEMMVALAVRIEEHIMEDRDYGDRTGEFFWEMITCLGLGGMNDDAYDMSYVKMVIDRFMARKYDYEGHGNIFTVENASTDMRRLEIWRQKNMFLMENY